MEVIGYRGFAIYIIHISTVYFVAVHIHTHIAITYVCMYDVCIWGSIIRYYGNIN